jgi:predicted NAD-dependent protein-ADP-ribosyltransferase YbiA (DUF1768 family)
VLILPLNRFFQWQKANYFHDHQTADKIAAVENGDPELCRELGRGVVGFDRETWRKMQSNIMESGELGTGREMLLNIETIGARTCSAKP